MSDELKPCPFCGGEAQFYLTEPKKIMCKHGHIFAGQFGYLGNSEKLAAAWNTRATPSAEVIALLVEALEWFTANLRVKEEDGTGSQYGRSSLWEGPEQAQLCICMATSSYSLASVGAIDGALTQARQALAAYRKAMS